jgi:hypothetical protein
MKKKKKMEDCVGVENLYEMHFETVTGRKDYYGNQRRSEAKKKKRPRTCV